MSSFTSDTARDASIRAHAPWRGKAYFRSLVNPRNSVAPLKIIGARDEREVRDVLSFPRWKINNRQQGAKIFEASDRTRNGSEKGWTNPGLEFVDNKVRF